MGLVSPKARFANVGDVAVAKDDTISGHLHELCTVQSSQWRADSRELRLVLGNGLVR